MMAAIRRNLRPASWPWDRQEHHYHESDISPPHFQLTVTKSDSTATIEDGQTEFNRGLWTRDLCIVGLILAWGASISSTTMAIYIIARGPQLIPPWLVLRTALVGPAGLSFVEADDVYMLDHRVYGVSEAAMVILSLLLQVAIASISLALDSIHSTTLRWALWREGRLHHNTNSRLFTFSRKHGPAAWPAGIASSLGLVLAYGGATMTTFPVTVTGVLEYTDKEHTSIRPNFNADLGPDRYGISFNAWGLLGLGAGLLLQSAVCTWCLVHDASEHIVGTWNPNPLATARASQRLLYDAGTNRNRRNLVPSEATPTQPPMRIMAPATRTITNWIWAIFALQSVFAIAVSAVASVGGITTFDFVAEFNGGVTFLSVWKYFGLVSVRYNFMFKKLRLEWAGLLIQSAFLSILLFGLHLADVIAGVARDEAIWRRATTTGACPESNSFLDGLRSWPTCFLFVFKAVVPWIFSFGVACMVQLFMAVLPLVTVSVLFLVLACFAEYIIRARPEGPQPATYGDIQALAVLVDDWGVEGRGTIFWGDKGVYEYVDGAHVRLAGTLGSRLADLKPGKMYAGLSGEAEVTAETALKQERGVAREASKGDS